MTVPNPSPEENVALYQGSCQEREVLTPTFLRFTQYYSELMLILGTQNTTVANQAVFGLMGVRWHMNFGLNCSHSGTNGPEGPCCGYLSSL